MPDNIRGKALDLDQGSVLRWRDVEECARSAFDVWVDQPELNWAHEAWERLALAGLTSYSGEVEKCRVKLRFLALAGIYHDWCSIAWQESANPSYSDWADMLEISALRIGQLMQCSDTELDQELDQDQLLRMAVERLVSLSRPEVLAGLLRAFGSTSHLFVSLWNSNKTDIRVCEEDEEDDSIIVGTKESEDDILNFDLEEKGPAYTWLDQGAEELLEPC